jgi:hypothetical protein
LPRHHGVAGRIADPLASADIMKTAASASVGSFSVGGYVPAPGQPPPPKPAALQSFANVLVQLRYAKGSPKPFRVKRLTDLGDDAAVGARLVLLDNETPAWGQWDKTAGAERLFAISKTDLLPGLTSRARVAVGVVAVGAVLGAFLVVRGRNA